MPRRIYIDVHGVVVAKNAIPDAVIQGCQYNPDTSFQSESMVSWRFRAFLSLHKTLLACNSEQMTTFSSTTL